MLPFAEEDNGTEAAAARAVKFPLALSIGGCLSCATEDKETFLLKQASSYYQHKLNILDRLVSVLVNMYMYSKYVIRSDV